MGNVQRLRRFLLLGWLAWCPVHASEMAVPEALRDWQQWVLKDKAYRDCPFFFDHAASRESDFACVWPGELDLKVDSAGARFDQAWTLYGGEQWLPLPGNAAHWPERVTVNDRPVRVVMRNGTPSLWLGPGRHRVSGRFAWAERPGVLALPTQSGLLSLQVDGRRVVRPMRTEQGLFLGEAGPDSPERNAVRTEIYRLVEDDVPTRLTTVLFVDVSGEVREELFGPLLPEGFVPLALDAELPARLESDGQLRLQVRPGEWRIEMQARAEDTLDVIGLEAGAGNLPDSEIWSYRPNVRQRVTQAEGPASVQPEQVGVPPDWRQLAAFRIRPGERLLVTERSRGMGAADNELRLYREVWLDFEGTGLLAADEISGRMRRGWRLDMAAPYRLLSARDWDDHLLVTEGAEAGWTGVELRHPQVMMQSLASIERNGRMPVTGWNTRFDAVNLGLNLPPGYKLLAAPGADLAHGSWASRWRLLDFFLISIITVGAWRLLGPAAGVVALLAVGLSYQEANAPAWVWLNLLIAMALLRVAPEGRLRRSAFVYQALSAAALVLWLVPFVAGQLRIAVYPQLEPQPIAWMGETAAEFEELRRAQAVSADSAGLEERARSLSSPEPPSQVIEEIVVTAAEPRQSYARYMPNAMVQTGPGIPAWRWNRHELSWSGPVDAGQTVRLVVAPRWLVSALRFLEVFLLLVFAALLAAEVLKRRLPLPRQWAQWLTGGAKAGGLLTVVSLGTLLAGAPPAEADLPDSQLLTELEKRLLEPPECAPRCAEVAHARIDVAADAVNMRLEVHALADVAVPLPGSEAGWRPAAVLFGGSAAGEVLRGPDGTLWAHVAAGRRSIEMSGSTPAADSLEIPFPAVPRVVEAHANGWDLAGIENRRLLSGSLHLTRVREAEGSQAGQQRWESSRFPTFVRIERTLEFGLDWRVTTEVSRIAPSAGALTLHVPLMAGESVTTPGLTRDGDRLLVSMAAGRNSVAWESLLPQQSPLSIDSAPGQPWQEVWRAEVGSDWRAQFTGVPESADSDGVSDVHVAEFHPRPGERLTIDLSRPEPSAGPTLAFDAVSLEVAKGKLSSTFDMTLEYRSTQGGQHILRLPEGAEVQRLVIDGDHEPFQADGRALSLPILPGEHTIGLGWRASGELGLRAGTPAVDLGAPASNINLQMRLPDSRWLLATQGPPLGPAVLYWSELAVLVLIALVLGRVALTPLQTRHWLLLGLGLSTYSWPVLGLVAAWLLACGARKRWHANLSTRLFNGIQIVIAALTLVALAALVTTLPEGLLGTPDMHVTGANSAGNSLNWFASHSESALPVATAWSVPLWIYQALILAWALWLSFALLRWLPWVWQCFSVDGLWHRRQPYQPDTPAE